MVIVLNCRRSGLFRETTCSRGRVTRLYWEQGYKSTDKWAPNHSDGECHAKRMENAKQPYKRALYNHGDKRELADIPTLLSAAITFPQSN
jgi:hypothetical protein